MANWLKTNAATYIAKWGNDTNAGTLLAPKKTILVSGITIIGTGEYEVSNLVLNYADIAGEGVVIIRPALSALVFFNGINTILRNLTIENFTHVTSVGANLFNTTWHNCRILKPSLPLSSIDTGSGQFISLYTCLLIRQKITWTTPTANFIYWQQNTFDKCVIIFGASNTTVLNTPAVYFCVFKETVLIFDKIVPIDYCLFGTDCLLGYSAGTNEQLVNPAAAALINGQKYYVRSGTLTVNAVAYAMDSVFTYTTGQSVSGTATVTLVYDYNAFKAKFVNTQQLNFNLANCTMGDPLFNNPLIYDYSIAPTSPARSMSNTGQAVGFESVGNAALATQAATGWTLTNMYYDVGLGGFTLTDPTIDGVAESPVITMLQTRLLDKLNISGDMSMKDGEYFDTESDLGTAIISGENPTLPVTPTVGEAYYNNGYATITVSNGGVTKTITAGNSFTAVTGDTITAVSSTASTNKVNQVIDAPNFLKCEMKYSTDNVTWTAYKPFLINQIPRIDNTGKTNGEAGYNQTTNFMIAAKHIQVRVRVKVGNVKS